MNKFKIAGAALLMVAAVFGMNAQTKTNGCCNEGKGDNVQVCKEGKKQCSKPAKMRQGNRCESMFEGIELTAEQKVEVDKLMAECKDRRQACAQEKMQKKAEAKAQNADKRNAERAELEAKVGKILTPEQFAVFKSNMAKKMSRPGHKGELMKGARKGECVKGECVKGECVKADCKKADCKKADCKKADCKKADCKKGDCKKADCKKADCKKADCKK